MSLFSLLSFSLPISSEPDTCGTRFLIPYPVETAKCDVSVEIVPQVLNITQVNITASFMNNNLSLSYEIAPNTSLVVPLNFTNFQSNEGPDEKAIGELIPDTRHSPRLHFFYICKLCIAMIVFWER